MRSVAPVIKRIVAALERTGYAVAPELIDPHGCADLAADCRALHAEGALQPASVGRAQTRQMRADIRSDVTCWFEPDALTPAQTMYWKAMQTLRVALNRALLLGLDELEAHYALYPPGARYAKHRDRFRDDDARVLSSVLYLNPDWHASDGGALRLYAPSQPRAAYIDVYPAAGTLVLFLSAEFEHEVLPATRERLSVAGWFRRRA